MINTISLVNICHHSDLMFESHLLVTPLYLPHAQPLGSCWRFPRTLSFRWLVWLCPRIASHPSSFWFTALSEVTHKHLPVMHKLQAAPPETPRPQPTPTSTLWADPESSGNRDVEQRHGASTGLTKKLVWTEIHKPKLAAWEPLGNLWQAPQFHFWGIQFTGAGQGLRVCLQQTPQLALTWGCAWIPPG